MAADPADLAYGHALAMLGDPSAAAEVAELALRRAGRARDQVLAHARQEAVARAALDEPVDIDSLQTVVLDLPALAATLASTRPPAERAALDVRARTGGDLAALGEALGLRPTDAADKTTEIAELWERTLDPALLAFSGPGECEGLAAILQASPRTTVAELLGAAPSVHAHTAACTLCTDRMRAMAPVRTFFSDANVHVPPAVREASRRDRTKRPSAPAAPLFPGDAPSRRRFVAVPLLAAALGLVVGVAVLLVRDEPRRKPAAVKTVAAVTGLRIVGDPATGLRLVNDSQRALRYTLSASVSWLRLSPAQGRLDAGATLPIVATLTADTPEGDTAATLMIHASNGASSSQQFTWHVERAPELATTVDGCSVGVTVVDDGDLANLQLHWRDTAEHVLDIAKADDNYSADLRPDNGPVTYWVTATDTRGNASRTADGVIQPGAC